MNENLTRPVAATDKRLEYLDELRKSGETNMFGAAAYLQRRFALDRATAKEVLLYWMASFEQRNPEG